MTARATEVDAKREDVVNESIGELTEEELRAFATEVASQLPVGGVLWLSGDLGAGKTTFAQSIARALEAGPALSPTYALIHEYPSPGRPVVHVDCYRLTTPAEALDLDFPDLARRARVMMIEWPERAGPNAPRPDVHLMFSHGRSASLRKVERVT